MITHSILITSTQIERLIIKYNTLYTSYNNKNEMSNKTLKNTSIAAKNGD